MELFCSKCLLGFFWLVTIYLSDVMAILYYHVLSVDLDLNPEVFRLLPWWIPRRLSFVPVGAATSVNES